jgi:hypothetical protein
MHPSDDPEHPQAGGTWRDDQACSLADTFGNGVRLRRDFLGTWWECALAVVALILVAWTLVDIARAGL